MTELFDVAVVGATGAVGEAMIAILEERDFPVGTLYPLASSRSAGKTIMFKGSTVKVTDLADFDFSKAIPEVTAIIKKADASEVKSTTLNLKQLAHDPNSVRISAKSSGSASPQCGMSVVSSFDTHINIRLSSMTSKGERFAVYNLQGALIAGCSSMGVDGFRKITFAPALPAGVYSIVYMNNSEKFSKIFIID